MLKSILKCTFGVLCLLSTNATAQDFSCCCCDDGFNGFYIGGNIGIISHNAHRNDLDGFLTDNSGWSTVDNGFIGGVQAGYDWQCGSGVFGLLVDWDATSNRRFVADNPNGGNGGVDNHLDWITTIRGRAGLAVCDSLLYITGGAAVTRLHTTWSQDADRFSHHDTRWGWVGGVGAEYKFCDCWNIGAELLYLNFENYNRSFTNAGGTRYTFGHSDSAVTGRLFVNYSLANLFSSYGY